MNKLFKIWMIAFVIVTAIMMGLLSPNVVNSYAAEPKEVINSSITISDTATSSKLSKDLIASYLRKVPAGTIIQSEDVMVVVMNKSEDPKMLTEFKDFCFVKQKDVIKKTIKNKNGTVSNITETVTEESKTFEVKAGKNEITVRLYDESNGKSLNSPKETVFVVEGIDNISPTFSEIKLSDYKITKKATPVTIMVSISGQDNHSKELLFAIKEKAVAIKDTDFSTKKEHDLTVKKNGTYVAYIKDAAGNVATKEIPITINDNEVPTIVSKSLVFEDNWNTKNIIRVKASDNYKPEMLKYRFMKTKAETKEPFGIWSEKNEIIIIENGTYEIEVKDVAGNISKTTIDVNNMDGENPTNLEIRAVS